MPCRLVHSVATIGWASTIGVAALDLGLRDHAIATTTVPTYLDRWTASTRPTPIGGVPAAAATATAKCLAEQADTDFHDGRGLGSAPGSTPGDCCSQCASLEWWKKGCKYFTWAQNTCWFKADNNNPIHSPGAISGGVTSAAPPPPAPPISLQIDGHAPGDLLTDLQRAGVIPDPWLDLTWRTNSSLWSDHAWTYSTHFNATTPVLAGSSSLLLVFEGVKMGATVRVNGQYIGVVQDQFLRYTFPLNVSDVNLMPGNNANRIDVAFGNLATDGAGNVSEDGRFMACTGGWDWAPYTDTITQSSRNTSGPAKTLSKGIWKPVYIVEVPTATVAITYLTSHTRYVGNYPTVRLVDGKHGGFTVNVTTHLWAPPGGAKGFLTVTGSWSGDERTVSTKAMTLLAGHSRISLDLHVYAEQIKLWWPNGLGSQPMYNVSATWAPIPMASTTTATRRMGFRAVALVTINDTDVATVATSSKGEGTGTHGMFFRVNGAALYSRGANMVPMEELEGRMSGAAHRILVKSSADAGMNTLRVWGGGVFYPTEFYDACDDYGVLLYHDMQYAGTGGTPHGPIATATQDAELRHQIRRLSNHPSIVLWDGANEVVVNPGTSSYIFATFVMTVVAQEDQSRAVWPSSPAKGWVTGVNRLYQTPNGKALSAPGGGHIWDQGIETHAPYQLGSGWPTVNGGVRDACFNDAGTGNGVSTPNDFQLWHLSNPKLNVVGPGGVQFKNIYASEFGTSGSSSFESMSGTLSKQHWGLHGGLPADNCDLPTHCLGEHECIGNNPMTQRNYGCDGQIRLYFGTNTTVDLDSTGEAAFKGQLYQCQLVQAFVLKQVYENRRASNAFGHLVWMLAEIWPTIGWGSLEYGPPPGYTPGQLMGGRWKPLHYFYKASLMTDVMATCGTQAYNYHTSPPTPGGQTLCYLSNHRAGEPFTGTVTLTSYDHFGDGKGRVLLEREMSLPAGPGAIEWFDLGGTGCRLPPGNLTTTISTVTDEVGTVLSEHMVQTVTPEHLCVPPAKLSVEILGTRTVDEVDDATIDIAVSSDRVALWVTLTSLAQGRFSDNAFFMEPGKKIVQFIPFSTATGRADDLQILIKTLRVEDLSMYRSFTACNASQ